MKTTVYIDGFNLYFGAINKTPYKWLDVVKLFTHICKDQVPKTEIVNVKFFTAPVLGRIARHGNDAVKSQNLYHKAMQTLYPELFQLITGYFQIEERHLPRFKKPINKDDTVAIWKMEEKKTDVNIALEMFIDAQEGIEQIVLVSNDTDLVPALEKINKHYPDTQRGIIIPRQEPKGEHTRAANKELLKNAHWVRHHITDKELEDSQLPDRIATKKKPVYKPEYW